MHLTDTLEPGGAERVAVNLVNLLPRDRYAMTLCTTRHEGLLASDVPDDVRRLRLARTHRFDSAAIRRLVAYNQHQDIQILHAHATSLFVATVASMFPPFPRLVWHNHCGDFAVKKRLTWPYRVAVRRASGVIAVTRALTEWSCDQLRLDPDRVWYIPNCVCHRGQDRTAADLPGQPGTRIVCVANLRPEKDHLTLVRAMSRITAEMPQAQLLLAGAPFDAAYVERIRQKVEELRLGACVWLLGQRNDISAILDACDVGVLSSVSEGLPLALLEYGLAGLPVVATRVGQCSEVLDDGQAGVLVQPGHPDQLATALIGLLRSSDRRVRLGARLRQRVQDIYSPDAVVRQIVRVYETVLDSPRRAA